MGKESKVTDSRHPVLHFHLTKSFPVGIPCDKRLWNHIFIYLSELKTTPVTSYSSQNNTIIHDSHWGKTHADWFWKYFLSPFPLAKQIPLAFRMLAIFTGNNLSHDLSRTHHNGFKINRSLMVSSWHYSSSNIFLQITFCHCIREREKISKPLATNLITYP